MFLDFVCFFSLDYFVLMLFAFVVLDLVFQYCAKRLAMKNVSEMTYFMLWDVKPYLSQSVHDEIQPCCGTGHVNASAVVSSTVWTGNMSH